METRPDAGVVCIGGAVVDCTFRLVDDAALRGISMRGRAVAGFGGVARNVAENLTRLGVIAPLISLVGDDDDGAALLRDLARCGVDARGVGRTRAASTARYVAAIDAQGELVIELADMTIFAHLSPETVARAKLGAAPWVFADGNVPGPTLATLTACVPPRQYRLAVDAVAVPRTALLPQRLDGIDVLFLNQAEAARYLQRSAADHHRAAADARAVRERGANAVVLTCGSRGVLVADDAGVSEIAAIPVEHVVDVTGAGDALTAATLARLLAGDDLRTAVSSGVRAASLTIESEGSVAAHLSPLRLR
ncbi:MAG: carbohydrate kinase family protein [Candidatus Elarobacter sp.]